MDKDLDGYNKKYFQEYYQSNKEELIKNAKQYYQDHKEERKKYSKNYHKKYKEDIKKYGIEYYHKNSHKFKSYAYNNKITLQRFANQEAKIAKRRELFFSQCENTIV